MAKAVYTAREAAQADVADYPGEIERVPHPEAERVYAEVSAAPSE